MFKGLNFSINKIVGSIFDLAIGGFGGGGQETLSSSKIETVFIEMFRKDDPIFMGATAGKDTPELPITFISLKGEIDRQRFSHIKKTLFSSLEPVSFKVLQDDLTNVTFKGIFTDSNPVSLGNGLYGIETKFKMVTNYGLENKKTKPLTNVFFNTSDSVKGLRPIIEFTMGTSGGNYTILNTTNGISMEFTDLAGDETITIDCANQIITSSLGFRRLGNFNKKWLVFEKGANKLEFSGTVKEVKVTYQNKKYVG